MGIKQNRVRSTSKQVPWSGFAQLIHNESGRQVFIVLVSVAQLLNDGMAFRNANARMNSQVCIEELNTHFEILNLLPGDTGFMPYGQF